MFTHPRQAVRPLSFTLRLNTVLGLTFGMGVAVLLALRGVPSILTVAALLVVPAAITVVLTLCARRPALTVVLLMVALALLPNSSVNFDDRIEGVGGIRLFVRYIGGVFSLWDLLLLMTAYIVVLRSRRFTTTAHIAYPNRVLILYFALWTFAIFNGLVHATIARYGFTSIRSVVQQSLPIIYLVISYILTRAIIHRKRDINLLLRTLMVCNVIILVQGTTLFVLSILGLFPALKGFLGIPIVIYDQMAFLTLTLNLVVAKLAYRQKITAIEWLVFIGAVFFTVVSTRRLPIIFLILNAVLIMFLGSRRRHAVKNWLRFFGSAILAVVAVVAISLTFVPQLGAALWLVLQSFNLGTEVGRAYAGELRLAQLENLFHNLVAQAPFSFLWGMGLGTYFFEFVPMGLSLDKGSTAYVSATLETGRYGWWPVFHLSYISLLYRYGFGGVLLLIVATLIWIRRWLRSQRRVIPHYQPLILMLTIVLGQALLALGESLDSAWPALVGIWLGVMEAVYFTSARSAAARVSPEQRDENNLSSVNTDALIGPANP